MSRKRPSGLKSANQDKKFRKVHKWHLRTCSLKILREHPRQAASEVPTQKCEIFL